MKKATRTSNIAFGRFFAELLNGHEYSMVWALSLTKLEEQVEINMQCQQSLYLNYLISFATLMPCRILISGENGGELTNY